MEGLESTYAQHLATLLRPYTYENMQANAALICKVWSEALKADASSDDFLLLLAGVNRILSELIRQIDELKLPQAASDLYKKNLKDISALIDIGQFGTEWRSVAVKKFKKSHIDILDLLHAALLDRFKIFEIEPTARHELETEIKEILESLAISDLPENVSTLMTRHLRYVLFVIQNFDILGMGALRDALSSVLGSAFYESAKDEVVKQSPIVKRIGRFLSKGLSYFNTAVTTARNIEYTHDQVRMLLDSSGS